MTVDRTVRGNAPSAVPSNDCSLCGQRGTIRPVGGPARPGSYGHPVLTFGCSNCCYREERNVSDGRVAFGPSN